MEPISMVICEVCGKLFAPTDNNTMCPECTNKQPEEKDNSMFDPVLVDGDADEDYDEDPDYDMDDETDEDEYDPFALDLDDDLFEE